MQIRRLLIFAIFFLLGSTSILAQSNKELKFETISINDGLSQGMVNAILQDHYGFMWFATNDGLNRFDGYNFSIFKNNVEDSNSIAGNFIRFLFRFFKYTCTTLQIHIIQRNVTMIIVMKILCKYVGGTIGGGTARFIYILLQQYCRNARHN